MHASEVTPEVAKRANELYWRSEHSVNQIAEDLDLSKGALYGVLEPEPSGLGCPLCGSEVGYPNRTAKDRGSVECPVCGWDGEAEETVTTIEGRARYEDDEGLAADPHAPVGSDVDRVPPPPPPTLRLPTIAGGALLGAAAGLALVLWTRRR